MYPKTLLTTRPRLQDIAETYVKQRQTSILTSTYSHQNTWIENDVRTNCYGFIKFLLKRHFNGAYNEILSFMENHRAIPPSIDDIPCPFHFSSFFTAIHKGLADSKYFQHVPHHDVQAGDLIVYEPQGHVPKSNAVFSQQPTGMHIMLVHNILSSYNNTVILNIIDCTKQAHDKYFDSRASLQDKKQSGIGTARLFLTRNAEGQFTRLKWRPGGKQYCKTITIGRLAP